MYQFAKDRYKQGKYTVEQVRQLVVNKWITETQFEEITGEQY